MNEQWKAKGHFNNWSEFKVDTNLFIPRIVEKEEYKNQFATKGGRGRVFITDKAMSLAKENIGKKVLSFDETFDTKDEADKVANSARSSCKYHNDKQEGLYEFRVTQNRNRVAVFVEYTNE